MKILSIQNLNVNFEQGGIRAVRGVSLDVQENETLCIIGESGSGKSTLAFSILGLQSSSATVTGSVKYRERELIGKSEMQMGQIRGKKIAMIFQEPMTSLNPVMSVGKQISEPLMQHTGLSANEARMEAKKLLEVVKIPNADARLQQYPHELSGGMRQRVMIAMALACKPDILIADEPTTALDVTIQAEILELLSDIRMERGLSVVFITHDLGVVAKIADRVAVMLKGEVVECGLARQIFNEPKHQYTRTLLRAALRADTAKTPTVKPNNKDQLLLDVRDVTKTFFGPRRNLFQRRPEINAVRDVSFQLIKGETLGIVGESGCGKSTLSRCVLNLIKPTSGKIFYQGHDTDNLSKTEWNRLRRKIQIVFQDPFSSLNSRITIGRALAEPLSVHMGISYTDALPKVKDLLAEVGLPEDTVDRYPHEFSGGQRQRIVIARALVLEPEVIIADEAVSALDVTIQAQILKLLKDIQSARGLSFIFITHDLAVLRDFCDRALVLYKGQIVEQGNVETLFMNPKEEYTRKLRDAAPLPQIM